MWKVRRNAERAAALDRAMIRRPAIRAQVGAKQRVDDLRSPGAYFCQVRFLWRLARSFLRRLCLLIFAFRRFFNEPMDGLWRNGAMEQCESCYPRGISHSGRSADIPFQPAKRAALVLF